MTCPPFTGFGENWVDQSPGTPVVGSMPYFSAVSPDDTLSLVTSTLHGRQMLASSNYTTTRSLLGMGNSDSYSYGGYWVDGASYGDSPISPQLLRIRDRISLGLAAGLNGARGWETADKNYFDSITPSAWPSSIYDDIPGWMFKSNTLTVIDARGSFAITGYSRTGAGAHLTSKPSTCGLAGGFLIDTEDGFARAVYGDGIVQDLSGAKAFGFEMAMKDRWDGTAPDPSPYGGAYRTIGYFVGCGGDSAYGGAAKTPVSAAFMVGPGSYPHANIDNGAEVPLARTANVVTATFASRFNVRVGEQITLSGAADNSFNGVHIVATVSSDLMTVSWAQTAADATSTGGSAVLTDLSAYKAQIGLLINYRALSGADGTGVSGQRAGKIVYAPAGSGYYWQSGLNIGVVGASVRSYVNSSGQDVHLIFDNGRAQLTKSLVVGSDNLFRTYTSANQFQIINSASSANNAGAIIEPGSAGLGVLAFATAGDTQTRGSVRFDIANNVLALRAGGDGSTTSGVDRVKVSAGVGVVMVPKPSATPTSNGDLALEATSNTSLTFRFKGSDGTVRSASLTLA